MRDAVIVGGGPNGLVCAAYLARAGLKPLVLERADRIGGTATTTEIAPGYRCSTLAHRASIDPLIIRALGLERHGLQIVKPKALVTAPSADGRALTLWADSTAAAREIASFSEKDARCYERFLASVSAVSAVVRSILSAEPPSIDHPGAADVLQLLKTGRSFRALSKRDAYRLLRWMPMPVADFVREWFESEVLQATLAAGGVLGSHVGVRSAGTAAIFLLLAAAGGHPIAQGWSAKGGMGALSAALAGAARAVGADIRTGAGVRSISVTDGAATGVVLENGEEIGARFVVSSADPRTTLLSLIDHVHLSPEFRRRVHNIRMRGALAKINFAVSSVPTFRGVSGNSGALSGCVRLGPTLDAIERAFDAAKYGRYSDEPWIELTIPSIADPSLAPSGQHVVSAYVQFTPYKLRDTTWDAERDRLADAATRMIDKYAPGFERSVVGRQIITPLDLERTYGLTGGHIFQGELALDQLFIARPLFGFARHDTPIRQLYLCGSGTHPGTGLDGRSGRLAAREILKKVR